MCARLTPLIDWGLSHRESPPSDGFGRWFCLRLRNERNWSWKWKENEKEREERSWLEEEEGASLTRTLRSCGQRKGILSIKIYLDKSKGLIGLSRGTCMDKVLNYLYTQEEKRGLFPMSHEIHLRKSKWTSSSSEQQSMNNVPYICTWHPVYHVLN